MFRWRHLHMSQSHLEVSVTSDQMCRWIGWIMKAIWHEFCTNRANYWQMYGHLPSSHSSQIMLSNYQSLLQVFLLASPMIIQFAILISCRIVLLILPPLPCDLLFSLLAILMIDHLFPCTFWLRMKVVQPIQNEFPQQKEGLKEPNHCIKRTCRCTSSINVLWMVLYSNLFVSMSLNSVHILNMRPLVLLHPFLSNMHLYSSTQWSLH